MWLAALVSIAVIIAAGTCMLFALRPVSPSTPQGQEQAPVEEADTQQAQATPAQEYADIVALVNQADRTVVPLSKLVSKTLDKKVSGQIKGVLAGKDAASALLGEASNRLSAVSSQLDPQAEGANAPVLADAISARADMLNYGSIVLNASVGAYELTDTVVDVWQHFIDGHDAQQEASAAVTSGTTKDVRRALKKDKGALSHFQKAQGDIEKIATRAPGADLDAERGYADLQVRAAQEAVETDEALLEEDSKAAKRHNASYQKLAASAVKAARKLPATTDDLVKSIYYSLGSDDVSVQDAQNMYEAAARRASKDDKKLADSTKAGTATSKES